ncbi:cystinosin-like protein ERS1 [Kluyveromyces lactis]|uniref:KLLA0F27445p n=1 Tax=Kluyveromyces lactis (strain ATCC 8585 / CBS 2359 / DSM 70799 / NBRC 1267 / NRRL Y-1140 / WM37) TaxID=284590 RepID=Q6CID8_KLULA|nr:uncharacterized protein KLLA0_F27445g [Kluyveromyces lactis]CAG99009.1 KLLA0F27445p [Kluyveromyces lactis]|eukprot:XP_456301.1 uncharacterized protein KLLA0_F27445g [Kluyveromyces lactis]
MERVLGITYVICWSVSVYPVVWANWKNGNANAVSFDYVVLNTVGYSCLLASMVLQKLFWAEGTDETLIAPEISGSDLIYCGHGTLLCFVLLSQFLLGNRLWNFSHTTRTHPKMHTVYKRMFSIIMLVVLVITIIFFTDILTVGLSNATLLSYCNNLSLVKITMSLIKHLPQVRHNFQRKSMAGFPIQSTCIDVLGSVCSLSQLALRLASKPQGLTLMSFFTNFGKIGIGLITLLFNIVYVSQWIVYSLSP